MIPLSHGKMFILRPGGHLCLIANPTSSAVNVKHVKMLTFLQAK